MGKLLSCFKAYDVRGKVPSELDEDLAYRIGRAYADTTHARSVCVGYDIRLSGPSLATALARGFNDAGVDVADLGMVGTEMVYFATANYGFDGGVMVTASHNPPEYNGMKMVRKESRPISTDSGLDEIERIAAEGAFTRSGAGATSPKDVYSDFVAHLLGLLEGFELSPLKLLLNPGNGAAGVALEALLPHLPFQVERMQFEPDGHFPNGVPNPILEESRASTEERLRAGDFDFGVAWDGDYDRCFFLDGGGRFIEGYYIVGLLAQALLSASPNHTIVYDPRLYWNTLDIVKRYGGRAVVCKSGHAFIKEKMREVDATYGGEMSAHHYFKQHWYCDSGMIPLLWVAQLVSASGSSLAGLVGEMIERYPCSGEVNSTVENVGEVLARVEKEYSGGEVSKIDGLSIDFPEWRFNLRGSNTEPVIRLNVETRGDRDLLAAKTDELLALTRTS
ncbi:MAG: phosphomannomutase/phosphoglucomutase [Chthonomonadaceae bacterium]|uniref:Phosphomannomutase CpsG n=1 Tax=Candidatus Nitrosymbiomonas proteolyticus TaxID=2608984 RepID=A0A809R8P2_9BACT|nr:phosphomannomutase CpsG [Candidatus Nitrosymbiomonas proteolyticus]